MRKAATSGSTMAKFELSFGFGRSRSSCGTKRVLVIAAAAAVTAAVRVVTAFL